MVRCAKTAEQIDMPFWTKTPVGPWNHVLHGEPCITWGADSPRGRGNFEGCPGHSKALTIFAAAVAAAFAANDIGREGGDGSAQRGRSVIYDCLLHTLYFKQYGPPDRLLITNNST